MKKCIVACLAVGVMVGGCVSDDGPGGGDAVCLDGKCDSWSPSTPEYVPDFAALNALWSGETPVQQIEDAYRVTVRAGGQQIVADTHLFGGPVNIIPFHNDDNVTDAAGNPIERGDSVVAAYFPPGEIGIGVMHHRPEHRVLDLDGADAANMKEHFKFQDTHIEIVVGVERDGQPGVITLNNPQDYQNGRFGRPVYVPFFLRPLYPDYLSAEQQAAFRDNIRTMALGFNAVSNFPGDYNGGDPLAANSPERVVEHVTMMIRAVAGDAEARAWFEEPAHQIYCAELAHVAFSAGLMVPLNAGSVVPLVGEETWAAFTEAVNLHNQGQPTAFTQMNDNGYAAIVEATLAPEDLHAAASYAPAHRADDAQRLAFQPMTMADMVEQFMRSHLPREVLGESLAPLQGAVLEQMRPGLLETMGMDQIPTDDPRRQAVDQLYDALVTVVSTQYGSYDEFRAALAPLMAQARAITGPRDDSGTGLFVPPSTMHVIAQNHHPGGLLGLRYVGHALHYSIVRPAGDTTQPEPDPQPAESGVLLEENGSVAQGQELRFQVTAPQGAERLRIDMLAEGDPDLYVRLGEAPTQDDWDCRPWNGRDQSETCEYAPPGGGSVYHIMVYGYDASEFMLQASWE